MPCTEEKRNPDRTPVPADMVEKRNPDRTPVPADMVFPPLPFRLFCPCLCHFLCLNRVPARQVKAAVGIFFAAADYNPDEGSAMEKSYRADEAAFAGLVRARLSNRVRVSVSVTTGTANTAATTTSYCHYYYH